MSSLTIKRAEKAIDFCTDLALTARHEQLDAELGDVRKKRQTLASHSEAELVAQLRDLERQMAESTVVFVLRALSNKRWAEHEAAHPPRKGDAADEAYSVNLSTFVDAVMPESIVSVTHKHDGSPVDFDPATDWMSLADEMSNAQFQVFALALLALNRGVTAAPFSLTASLATPR
ncbi:hypothetical protein [Cellulomonas gilvus]|uniref:Uncharacterized protein n=1 Tax=Cellulomonas gilvus (strain ATCC 13127 / NRRL B-14078) TaxID=593907 RepID=F8A2F7_CELGA|nr:hypothetical protein [Cellulomonas gilvus]AEI11814.1 hypothetical protein Celgi_1295 [Cellulomonas gilvus ATCC 13127]